MGYISDPSINAQRQNNTDWEEGQQTYKQTQLLILVSDGSISLCCRMVKMT